MPFEKAISTLGCPELSLVQAVQLAAEFHLPAIEVRALEGTTDLPRVFARAYGEPTRMALALEKSPVRIAVLGTSLRLVGQGEAERRSFLEFVPWAEALRIRWLRVFDGGRTAEGGERDEALRTLGWWRELRARHGWHVEIMVETHDSLLTAAKIQAFATAAEGAAILWDTHHTWRAGGEDPVATWPAIAPWVAHIHVKDSLTRVSGKYDYVLPGTGEFPIRPLLERIVGFNGLVSLEWERLWHPELPPLEEALRSAARRGWW